MKFWNILTTALIIFLFGFTIYWKEKALDYKTQIETMQLAQIKMDKAREIKAVDVEPGDVLRLTVTRKKPIPKKIEIRYIDEE